MERIFEGNKVLPAERIIVNGGRSLVGSITVSGSKNAALPILFSAITTVGISKIHRFPKIGDTAVAISLLEDLGAKTSFIDNTLYIDSRNLSYTPGDDKKLSQIRASTYLMGANLARFGECAISDFGGCNFSSRPIDMHIEACRAFGAEVQGRIIKAKRLRGAKIDFKKASVGATINAIIMAASADGESIVSGYAREPHVLALAAFLRSAGADILFKEDRILIKGAELHGGDISVIGDMIEAGTYLAAGLITGGSISVLGCNKSELSSYLDVLSDMGVAVSVHAGAIRAEANGILKRGTIVAEPYPAYPTDLQPIIAPLLAKYAGGAISDRVWRSRYGYLASLAPFGVEYRILKDRAYIYPSRIRPAIAEAPDLRGGAAALICALAADGESSVLRPERIFRGYEDLISKLRSVGADIKYESVSAEGDEHTTQKHYQKY